MDKFKGMMTSLSLHIGLRLNGCTPNWIKNFILTLILARSIQKLMVCLFSGGSEAISTHRTDELSACGLKRLLNPDLCASCYSQLVQIPNGSMITA